MPTRTALIVEDGEELARVLQRALARWQFEAQVAATLEEAEAALEAAPVDLVLLDIGLPDGSGLDLLGYLQLNAPHTEAIVMTGHEDLILAARAMSRGAIEFLSKPFEIEDLGTVVRRWIQRRDSGTYVEEPSELPRRRHRPGRTHDEPAPADPSGALPALIGRHPLMIVLFKRLGLAAAGREPVLIRGESGTGRELVARTLQRLANPDQPFLTLNCVALPAHLLATELFGQGDLGSSVAGRPGRMTLAAGGTLFLEEIGETPLAFQIQLRDVLRDQHFTPVDSDTPIPLEARIIASTHHNLEALIEEGEFDGGLFDELRTFELQVPPLRHRVIDIPDIARHVARRVAERAGRSEAPRFTSAAVEALRAHPWPGNLRELEAAVRRAVPQAGEEAIAPEHLGLSRAPRGMLNLEGTLDDVVHQYAQSVLETCDGNKREAARRLDISPGRLYRILEHEG